MILLMLSAAAIAFIVAGVAALCAAVPERRWMWSTPLWLAPLVVIVIFGIRHLLAADGDQAMADEATARFVLAIALAAVWLPGALLGWKAGRAFAARRR